MMHGREKSGLAIVAMKPPNEAGLPVEEVVERRAGPRGMRAITTRPGHRAGPAWNWSWTAYDTIGGNASPSLTRGGSRMRESRTYGSVRGAASNGRPYRV